MSNNLFISYDEWYNYIKVNKLKLLNKVDSSSLLEGSKDYKIFINLLQELFKVDTFDISRISYLAFSFLDLYINSYLSTIIHKHKIHQDRDPNDPNINIHNILYFIVKLIIHIEFTLNLHLFILVYLLKKNDKYNLTSNSNSNKQNFVKPKILLKFEKIYNDLELNIESSSILLLLLKLNYKISNIFDYLDDDIILKENELINKNNNENKNKNENKNENKNDNNTYKINYLLDSFILAIENIYKPDEQDDADNKVVKKYSICMNYIIDLSNLSYNYFNLGFEILIKYLKIEYPDKNELFDIIHRTISTFLKNELNLLENTLLENTLLE